MLTIKIFLHKTGLFHKWSKWIPCKDWDDFKDYWWKRKCSICGKLQTKSKSK